MALQVVDIATNKSSSGSFHLRKGWFLVRNRAGKDGDSFDQKAAEESLFSSAPWSSIPKEQLGSTALKTYLGRVLSSKIRSCFPELHADIESTLRQKLVEKQSLGEPRDTRAAKQHYAINIVRKFEEMAGWALERPEALPEAVRRLRWEVSQLNQLFDTFMRARGGTWDFMDAEIDPFAKIAEALNKESTPSGTPKLTSKKVPAGLEKQYPNCSHVKEPEDLMRTIDEQLIKYQAAQLPGIVNPIVYPKMYQMQVEKWETITHRHLLLVTKTVELCYQSILDSVCPSHGDSNTLRKELDKFLEASLDSSYQAAEAHRERACRQETKCTMLQTTAPGFGEQVLGWRQLRFFQAVQAAQTVEIGEGGNLAAFVNYFELAHPSLEKNMIYDVHDILKVYYKVWLPRVCLAKKLLTRYSPDHLGVFYSKHDSLNRRGLHLQ